MYFNIYSGNLNIPLTSTVHFVILLIEFTDNLYTHTCYFPVYTIILRAVEAELNIFSDGCLSPSF